MDNPIHPELPVFRRPRPARLAPAQAKLRAGFVLGCALTTPACGGNVHHGIVPSISGADSLTVAGGQVYWSSDGSSCNGSPTGGAAVFRAAVPTTVGMGLDLATSRFVVDATTVYTVTVSSSSLEARAFPR